MNIDMHCHIITEEMLRLLQGVSKQYAPRLSTGGRPYPAGLTTSSQGFIMHLPGDRRTTWPEGGHNVGLRLEDMARTGVDCQAISQWPSMFMYDIPAEVGIEFAKVQNEQFAQLKRNHPGKFAPLAAVPLQDGQAAADELERAIKVLGLHGVATATSVALRKDFDDPSLEPFWAKLNELQVPWFIHSSGSTIAPRVPRYYLPNFVGNPLETTIAVCTLIFGGVIERYPNIRCWTPHGGGYVPYQFGRYDHGYQWRDEPKVIIKKQPSAYLPAFKFDCITHSKPALNYLVQTFGPHQVYLGTDYPFDMGLPDPVGAIDAIETTDDAGKALIKGGNARAALGLH